MSVKARRALISVYDKSGLPAFASALIDLDIELVSTGTTARTIRDAGFPCTEVAEITGFPEILDGRVKTLHPRIHGGLLALRQNSAHMATLAEHNIGPIDIVAVNLYPFEKTIAQPGCTFADAVENIDIGGPTMLRSAAKNHESIYVVSSPAQYDDVVAKLQADDGLIDGAFGRQLALEVFRQTAAYDSAITQYLTAQAALSQ